MEDNVMEFCQWLMSEKGIEAGSLTDYINNNQDEVMRLAHEFKKPKFKIGGKIEAATDKFKCGGKVKRKVEKHAGGGVGSAIMGALNKVMSPAAKIAPGAGSTAALAAEPAATKSSLPSVGTGQPRLQENNISRRIDNKADRFADRANARAARLNARADRIAARTENRAARAEARAANPAAGGGFGNFLGQFVGGMASQLSGMFGIGNGGNNPAAPAASDATATATTSTQTSGSTQAQQTAAANGQETATGAQSDSTTTQPAANASAPTQGTQAGGAQTNATGGAQPAAAQPSQLQQFRSQKSSLGDVRNAAKSAYGFNNNKQFRSAYRTAKQQFRSDGMSRRDAKLAAQQQMMDPTSRLPQIKPQLSMSVDNSILNKMNQNSQLHSSVQQGLEGIAQPQVQNTDIKYDTGADQFNINMNDGLLDPNSLQQVQTNGISAGQPAYQGTPQHVSQRFNSAAGIPTTQSMMADYQDGKNPYAGKARTRVPVVAAAPSRFGLAHLYNGGIIKAEDGRILLNPFRLSRDKYYQKHKSYDNSVEGFRTNSGDEVELITRRSSFPGYNGVDSTVIVTPADGSKMVFHNHPYDNTRNWKGFNVDTFKEVDPSEVFELLKRFERAKSRSKK